MNTIKNMRQVADLLAGQRRYTDAFTVYDELYRKIWGVFGIVQYDMHKISNKGVKVRPGSQNHFQNIYLESVISCLSNKLYNIDASNLLNEFIHILYGRLKCICASGILRAETEYNEVLCEYAVLYMLISQPEEKKKIGPVFAVATAVLDGNKLLKNIRPKYQQHSINTFLIECAVKIKNGRWRPLNNLLRDYIFISGGHRSELYESFLKIADPLSQNNGRKAHKESDRYDSSKRYSYDNYTKNERYEQYKKQSGTSSGNFQPATATEEEKKKHYGKTIGLSGVVTKEQIRSNYINLVSQYHPDRVQHLGPELKELAELKTKEINAAYGWLKTKYQI